MINEKTGYNVTKAFDHFKILIYDILRDVSGWFIEI